MKEKIKAVVMGHAVADALGVPVEFSTRAERDASPLTDMIGYGTYPYPAGCWSDDTSMSLCALDSLCSGKVDFHEIMANFARWYYDDEYTPTGTLFDVGGVCASAIRRYRMEGREPVLCGLGEPTANGNGSLMRIHSFSLYAYQKGMRLCEWERLIFDASALTHAHLRSKIACGIYTLILHSLLDMPSIEGLRRGIEKAYTHYCHNTEATTYYRRLLCEDFPNLPRHRIRSSGYVVDTLEAAVWCLFNSTSYQECVLMAANLGEDTDTVAAIAGGLAGALYGYEGIPTKWLDTLKKREELEQMCERAYAAWSSLSST